MPNKKAMLLFGLAGAAGVGWLLMSGDKAQAAPATDEFPDVGPVPEGEDLEDAALREPDDSLPTDRVTAEEVNEEDFEVRTTDFVPPEVQRKGDEPKERKAAPAPPPEVPRKPPPEKRKIKKRAPPALPDIEDVVDDVAEQIPGGTEVVEQVKAQLPDIEPELDEIEMDEPEEGKPLPEPEIEPGEEVRAPDADPLDPVTEKMLRVLLDKEYRPDWKAKEQVVANWQKARGIKADKMFGPGSARLLAQETGLLPIVRYWPRGAQKNRAVPRLQADLLDLADEAEEPRRTHLLAAAEREQGQGFGTPPKPISPTIAI